MIFTPAAIAGAYVIDLEPREDERGSFARAFCLREFQEQGITFSVVQCNLARSHRAGIVRGLHYQEKPAEEQKFVRCVAGAVLDVLVDMRPSSPTYQTVFSERLDNINRKALFIPAGVAHGYQVLLDQTEFMYMTDQYYAPGLERGLCYNDPALGIQWPLPAHGVALRDQQWPSLNWQRTHRDQN